MILVVSTCSQAFSELEFVEPIKALVGECFVRRIHEVSSADVLRASKIIICGTALKDFAYLDADFSWISKCNKPILGICAGMQCIGLAFGCELVDNTLIGVHKVYVVGKKLEYNAYFLHTKSVVGLESLAVVNGSPCFVRHPSKQIFGCIFHPEVMNPEIITNFINGSSSTSNGGKDE